VKVTPEIAHALMGLRNNSQFREFVNGLSDYGEEVVQKMIYGTKDDREKLAGMAFAITEVLKAVGTDPEKLNQIVESKQ
jgi:hypothetical protein